MAEMKRIWDNFVQVGEVQKTERTKFVVSAATRDGYRYIVIREFYKTKKTNEWHPGRDGIMIPMTVPLNDGSNMIMPYSNLHNMVEDAAKMAATMQLMDEANMVMIERKPKNAD